MWHKVVSLTGEADRSGESTAHTLNSKLLLVKKQEQDADPTLLHPCFSLLVLLLPLVLVEWTEWIGVLPANPDSAQGRDGVRTGTALSSLSMTSEPHTAQEAAAASLSPFTGEDTVAQKADHLPKLP